MTCQCRNRLSSPRTLFLSVAALAACSANEGAKSGDSRAGAGSPDTAAAAIAPASSHPKTAGSDYLGFAYDALPAAFTYRDGSVIPPSAATHGAEYDLAHVTTPEGEMVWLDTLGASGAKGQRAKVVRAQLAIPRLANDERLFMASCDANGKLDPRVVAIVINGHGATKLTNIRQAWRVDIPASRFDVIPVEGIACEDPDA